ALLPVPHPLLSSLIACSCFSAVHPKQKVWQPHSGNPYPLDQKWILPIRLVLLRPPVLPLIRFLDGPDSHRLDRPPHHAIGLQEYGLDWQTTGLPVHDKPYLPVQNPSSSLPGQLPVFGVAVSIKRILQPLCAFL